MPQTPAFSDIDTTSAEESLWFAAPAPPPRPPLRGELVVDVAVIGGGIAGVTTALALQRSGATVALLEASTVASGVTGCTSAKVSALQATTLSKISSRHGPETTAIYAAASRQAVEDVARLALECGVNCDLERRAAVTYAADPGQLKSVEREYETALTAGLPVRWSDTDAGVPYGVSGAVWLDDQLGFQPVSYVRGLADAFVAAGGKIFENSRVLSVGVSAPVKVRTASGTVRARQVVVASHFPILDRGLFFSRMEVQRSYCIAAPVREGLPSAMAISAGSNSRSIQFHNNTVIVGGEGHAAGASGVDAARFSPLERFVAEHWTGAKAQWRWSAQDPIPYDHLPMIGPYLPRSKRIWVATGWAKWGLTGGTLAAGVISDGILGRANPWAATFSPNRLTLRSTPKIAALGAKFSGYMALDRITPAEVSSTDAIPLGEARVLREGIAKAGVYRDEGGRLHGVSLRCSHLGCLLRFNGAERSWDCPCHGSRFDIDGTVLEGPAVHPLKTRDVT